MTNPNNIKKQDRKSILIIGAGAMGGTTAEVFKKQYYNVELLRIVSEIESGTRKITPNNFDLLNKA